MTILAEIEQQRPYKEPKKTLKDITIVRLVLTASNASLSMIRCIDRETMTAITIDMCCQVIYSQFGLAIHQNDHQARRRFVEWAQNEIAVVPDFHKRILFSDEAHFWLNGYVNKQNCRIWNEANPQVYVETPLHPEKLTVWCALWAGGSLVRTSLKTMKASTLQSIVIGIEP
ncbi:uncharacterized protein TNCV_3011391 [Trichonephila clavipes]|nr:uncharacterized protein TNCV_3011391 [Trichonephila clavipes]